MAAPELHTPHDPGLTEDGEPWYDAFRREQERSGRQFFAAICLGAIGIVTGLAALFAMARNVSNG